MIELIVIMTVAGLGYVFIRRRRKPVDPVGTARADQSITPGLGHIERDDEPSVPAPEPEKIPIDDLVCEIRYTSGAGEESAREIQPLSVMGGPHAPIINAYCRTARAFRMFRTDRISEVVDHDGEVLDIATYLQRHADIDLNTVPVVPMPAPLNRPTIETMNAARKTKQPGARTLPATDSPLASETVVFTGTVPGMTRKQAQAAARQLGAQVMTNVTAKTTLVVAGSGSGSRLASAQKRDVTIMNADEWLAMLADNGIRPG